jgi:hypothetical protein
MRMFVTVHYGAGRQTAVAVQHAPTADHKTFGMDRQAVRGVGEAAVVIAGNDGRFDSGRGQPGNQFRGKIGVDAGLEQVAGDDDMADGVSRNHGSQRSEDEGKIGRRHGFAVTTAGVVIAEMEVGKDGGCRWQVDGDAGRR